MAERRPRKTAAKKPTARKTATKNNARDTGATATPAARTGKLPFVQQLGQDILKRFTGEWSEERAKSLLSDVTNRRRPVEAALLDLLGSAQTAVEKSLVDVQERAKRELALAKAYRGQLAARGREPKRARARKGDIRLKGQVVHPETGKPVAGVVVEAANRGPYEHDLLGVVITDDQGRFEFTFRGKDEKEKGEKEPEIMLSVGPDRSKTFYVSEQPVGLKLDGQESITLTVPKSRAAELDAFLARRDTLAAAKRTMKANEALTRHAVEGQVLSAAGPAATSLLEEGIALLKQRLEKAR